MARLDDLLRQMKQQGASDLHLTSGSAPYMRINGEMVKLHYRNVSAETCQGLIFEILTENQKELFTENCDLDLSYPLQGVGRFRVNVFMQRNGISAVFRLIPENIKTIRELDLPEQLASLIDVSEGLILVTGPTGSGKSTTLASLIHTINDRQQAHIITIEDPIEFVHENRRCLISQRELSSHTKSFGAALRAALREDRDIDVFPEGEQAQIRVMLSESLRGVVAQALLPRPDHLGRVPVVEVLVNVPAVANLIREGKTHQIASVMQTGRAHGMVTFEGAIQDLIQRNLISKEDGVSFLRRRSAGKQLTGAGSPTMRLANSPALV